MEEGVIQTEVQPCVVEERATDKCKAVFRPVSPCRQPNGNRKPQGERSNHVYEPPCGSTDRVALIGEGAQRFARDRDKRDCEDLKIGSRASSRNGE